MNHLILGGTREFTFNQTLYAYTNGEAKRLKNLARGPEAVSYQQHNPPGLDLTQSGPFMSIPKGSCLYRQRTAEFISKGHSGS